MFPWTLLAFVESPGSANRPTAVLLLRKARESFPTLHAGGLLEAASELALGRDGRVMQEALLVGVRAVLLEFLYSAAAVHLRHLMNLNRCLRGMINVNVHHTLAMAVAQWECVCGLDVGARAVLRRHLAELSGEVRWTLAFISRVTLPSIHTGQVTHHDSEVGGGECVCGAPVLADDGGGVSFLAGVVAATAATRQLADGRREDQFDPTRVIGHV